jgi:aarF domain-containing kinase
VIPITLQIISRLSEAYGHMMLKTGLFHADAHPGNVLVLPGGVVGLIDYGQSKQLTDEERLLFAKLVVSLAEYALPTKPLLPVVERKHEWCPC